MNTQDLERRTNIAARNRWILTISLKKIIPSLTQSDMIFNICGFKVPTIHIKFAEIGARGVNLMYPTGIRDEDKTLTIKYVMSADYNQYMLLYSWANIISDQNITNGAQLGKLKNWATDFTFDLLTPFKQSGVLTITYHNCIIYQIDELDMDYQSPEEEITHSFSVYYSHFTISSPSLITSNNDNALETIKDNNVQKVGINLDEKSKLMASSSNVNNVQGPSKLNAPMVNLDQKASGMF